MRCSGHSLRLHDVEEDVERGSMKVNIEPQVQTRTRPGRSGDSWTNEWGRA